MAEIFGTGHYNFVLHRYFGFADTLDGTSGNDTIWGGGGNDHIYGGAGDDEMHGGTGDDIIVANPQNPYTTGAWGHDVAYGESGNDFLAFGNTTNSVILYGDDINNTEAGNDTITGGSAGDHIYGGGGDDTIFGQGGNDIIYGDNFTGSGSGNDTIYGGAGYDQIWGGDGNDTISGGTGFDDLYGGKGADTFVFANGDSGKNYADADVIHDFNASTNSFSVWDRLDLDGQANATNFGHINGFLNTDKDLTFKAEYDHALNFAQNVMNAEHQLKYEFVTDGHDGWVFVDTNGNHTIDYGIELKGVTDLHWQNIV